jgi:hypothetical protein
MALSPDHREAPNPRLIKEHHLGIGTPPPSVIRRAVQEGLILTFGKDDWIEKVSVVYI